mmetsp:Transcript_64645/g.121157  ORF Transcript_64645/g.121157 Transcript_64645/m.121157 type:complete len:230 (-) Transcript_64645:154-843(-)
MMKSSSDDTNAVFVAEAKAGCSYLPLLFCSGSGAAFLLLLGLVARTRIALDKRFVCILNGQISIRVNNGTQQSHVLLSADVGVVVLIDATKPLRLDVPISFLDETLTAPHSALELFLGLHRLRKHPSKIELGATHAKCEDRIVSSAVVLLVPIFENFFEISGKVIDSSYLCGVRNVCASLQPHCTSRRTNFSGVRNVHHGLVRNFANPLAVRTTVRAVQHLRIGTTGQT